MTNRREPARRPLRVLLVIAWALMAVVSGVAILFGALTSALNSAGFETTFSNPTPLFVLCLVASVAAGVCGFLLGGRWWTVPLVAAPALIFGLSFLLSGSWVSTALLASPIVACAGVACVLALPRRRAARHPRDAN